MQEHRSSGPLCNEAARFLNLSTHKSEESALTIYEELEAALRDPARHGQFTSMLSPAQETSLRIIQEWWNCSIEDESWFCENRDRVKHMQVLECASPLAISMIFGIGPDILRISTYRLELSRLFQMEFNPLEFQEAQNKTVYLDFLHQHRERSAFYAAVQRITFPFRFVNVVEQGSSPPVKPSKTPNLMQRPLGPSIGPCPWLKFQKSRTGYPYFLWDVDCRCTIKVEDMETSPKYTCISHTWGRWRDISKPDIAITGVPWLVPQNKRFKVEDLPDHLSDAFAGRYVWLDLFCIPQDRSERSLIEISRQANIFGNASVVIAWLNSITSWCGLRETIRWLSMFCLKNYTYLNTDQVFLPPDLDSQSAGLVLEQSNPIDPDHTSTPASWFTSLWTLQEACLRPDIILCNKDFEILTVGHNTLVTLEELAALLNYAIGDYGQSPYESVVNLEKTPQHMRDGSVLEFEHLNSSASGRQRRILEDLPKTLKGCFGAFRFAC